MHIGVGRRREEEGLVRYDDVQRKQPRRRQKLQGTRNVGDGCGFDTIWLLSL